MNTLHYITAHYIVQLCWYNIQAHVG